MEQKQILKVLKYGGGVYFINPNNDSLLFKQAGGFNWVSIGKETLKEQQDKYSGMFVFERPTYLQVCFYAYHTAGVFGSFGFMLAEKLSVLDFDNLVSRLKANNEVITYN